MLEPANHIPSEAFILALTASQTALRGYCQASLGHGEEAKEALQRTSIVLWKKCENWNPETDFLRWAISVAKFEVLGVIRDRKRDKKRIVFATDVVELMVDEASEIGDVNRCQAPIDGQTKADSRILSEQWSSASPSRRTEFHFVTKKQADVLQ